MKQFRVQFEKDIKLFFYKSHGILKTITTESFNLVHISQKYEGLFVYKKKKKYVDFLEEIFKDKRELVDDEIIVILKPFGFDDDILRERLNFLWNKSTRMAINYMFTERWPTPDDILEVSALARIMANVEAYENDHVETIEEIGADELFCNSYIYYSILALCRKTWNEYIIQIVNDAKQLVRSRQSWHIFQVLCNWCMGRNNGLSPQSDQFC